MTVRYRIRVDDLLGFCDPIVIVVLWLDLDLLQIVVVFIWEVWQIIQRVLNLPPRQAPLPPGHGPETVRKKNIFSTGTNIQYSFR